MFLLAEVDFRSPVLWAVVAGWICSVVLHELAHGIVATMGGDYTIRQRGGLTLNPFAYMDPVMSIGLPLLFLLQGGVPLPGGGILIRRDLLRSRLWETAVSLAGPATNCLLFLLLALPFHPRIGWIHASLVTPVSAWGPLNLFLATMVVLQFMVMIFNLLPIPPLDGFRAIAPYFDGPTQAMLLSRQASFAGLFLLYFFVANHLTQGIYRLEDSTLASLGFDPITIWNIGQAFNKVMFNK